MEIGATHENIKSTHNFSTHISLAYYNEPI